ncbi:hypothetical protein Ddye_019822 [Dipteronia dyeriana]|uniref:PGG domain-containing protein n=1 Tax=Dipteronia dyeriana TaxID=168575 RepID=A0AAD9WW35_9ROSI|nr:hypothetical protein Ddye_019822 [Dipteronia dyeriana]
MFNFPSMKKPYQAVIEGKWEALEEIFDYDEGFSISYPIMTVAKDNAFHIAVHSKSEKPLKHLLERVNHEQMRTNVLYTNAYENTVLHEAAINHNIAAVKLLVGDGYVTNEHLLERNKSGQTPLFKAAAFGSTKVVKYLASEPNQMTCGNYKKLQGAHRTKNDGTSILHAAVRGEHFGTALELLKLDQGLVDLKTQNGMTSLHLLTNLRSAFTKKYSNDLWHRFLYFCMSTNYNIDHLISAFNSQELIYVCHIFFNNVWVLTLSMDYDADNIGVEENDVKGANNISKDEYDDKVGDNLTPTRLTISVFETIKISFWNYFIGGKLSLSFMYELYYTYMTVSYICTSNKNLYYICTATTMRNIWKEKRKHKFAFKLARELIKNDDSWHQSFTEDTTENYRSPSDGPIQVQIIKPDDLQIDIPVQIIKSDDLQTLDIVEDIEDPTIKQPAADQQTDQTAEDKHQVETPLLAATRTGVIELVKEILKKHPQAVEHVSHKKQNILHVAASYRQRNIFELVKQMQMPAGRLILGIDEDSYTVLHHVADTRNYTGGTRPGPAYQLQDELEWFQSVEEIMPSYFTQHVHDKTNMTARELFIEKHKIQLKEAQQWIKDTSQSCSGVAVLVATVVFAAAFTVPGGNNDENGLPILIHTPFFMFFTVMDVVSLSCSLTAVVMFLSIITSPFELDNFRLSLPRRLTLGFALLFMSVATTMLAFTSTIFLIIRTEQRRRWTLSLICSTAFVPPTQIWTTSVSHPPSTTGHHKSHPILSIFSIEQQFGPKQ